MCSIPFRQRGREQLVCCPACCVLRCAACWRPLRAGVRCVLLRGVRCAGPAACCCVASDAQGPLRALFWAVLGWARLGAVHHVGLRSARTGLGSCGAPMFICGVPTPVWTIPAFVAQKWPLCVVLLALPNQPCRLRHLERAEACQGHNGCEGCEEEGGEDRAEEDGEEGHEEEGHQEEVSALALALLSPTSIGISRCHRNSNSRAVQRTRCASRRVAACRAALTYDRIESVSLDGACQSVRFLRLLPSGVSAIADASNNGLVVRQR